MKKSPLQVVKEKFETKAALVDAVRMLAGDDLWADRLGEGQGLEQVSNRKLLRLHGILSAVKASHGTRGALVDDILRLEGRAKDADYRSRFETWPTPRLVGYLEALKRKTAKRPSA